MGSETGEPGSYAERDRAIIERYNKLLKESQEREFRLHRHYEWQGNKIPPFAIEPMPYERQRLAKQMTPEQRAARIQWLKDQELAPHEPVEIRELYPRNPIRRMLAAPWNGIFNMLKPVVGADVASHGRMLLPRALLAMTAFYGLIYHYKYNAARWEGQQGFYTWESKPTVLPGDVLWPEGEQKEEFMDHGFKSRISHQNLKTSSL